jgi:hypothetical protein
MSTKKCLTMAAFSILFTLNIAVSNISLGAVSVPFHQTMRSATPVVTILLYNLIYFCGGTGPLRCDFSGETYLTMIPLILGIAFTTKGDFTATTMGCFLTMAGVVLASAKQVAMQFLMNGTVRLSSQELLLRLSPLAIIQCLV